MKLDIITVPNPILNQKSQEVEVIDAEINKLILQMKQALIENNGIGLAAPQVGHSKRLFVIGAEKEIKRQDGSVVNIPFMAIINPEVIYMPKKRQTKEEGCLSVPGIWGNVERALKISIAALNKEGKKIKIDADGLMAQIIQHEIDHLDGILFTQKADVNSLYRIDKEGNKVYLNL